MSSPATPATPLPVRLDAATERRLAAEAHYCDPRSIRRELAAPGSVRGVVGDAIRAVLAAHGLPVAARVVVVVGGVVPVLSAAAHVRTVEVR